MSTVDYGAALASLNAREDADFVDALMEAARIISGHGDKEVRRRLGKNATYDDLNELHDALVDKVIAQYEGDPRVALFCVLCLTGDLFNTLDRIREAAS